MLYKRAKFFQRSGLLSQANGFTLLEALVTIGLTVIILSVYTAMLTSVYYISRTQFGIQATGFVQEGLDVLRTLEHDDLLNRTDGNLLGLAFTRGEWSVTGGNDNVLELQAPTNESWHSETGLAILPGNYRDDFTFTADVLVASGSPIGWGTGLAFRYRDEENHYRFRFGSGGIALDEVYRGTITTLWTQSATYNKNVWYEIEVVTNGDQITLRRNGVNLTTVTNTRFTTGDLALIALSNALVSFDDVAVSGDGADSWSFEDYPDNEYPDEWRRFNAFDLPGGDIKLTIENYLGQADMKKATVTASWRETGATKEISGSSIITR
ncbi:MAG: hypothetical protein V1738_01655 [Patescibacteria group bacterium]